MESWNWTRFSCLRFAGCGLSRMFLSWMKVLVCPEYTGFSRVCDGKPEEEQITLDTQSDIEEALTSDKCHQI